MKSLIALSFVAIGLAGCEKCEIKFEKGQFVRHRMSGEEGIVIRQASIPNLEGYCLVTARMAKQDLVNLAVEELEPRP